MLAPGWRLPPAIALPRRRVMARLLVGGPTAGWLLVLAFTIVSPIPVFAGVGALASQLAPRRRSRRDRSWRRLPSRCLLRAIADTSVRRGMAAMGHAPRVGRADRPYVRPRPALVLLVPRRRGALFAARVADLRRGGTSAPACSLPRFSAPPRLRAAVARRPPRRSAPSSDDRLLDPLHRCVRVHPRRGLRRASPPPVSPRSSNGRSPSSAPARSSRRRAIIGVRVPRSSSSRLVCSPARRSPRRVGRRPTSQFETCSPSGGTAAVAVGRLTLPRARRRDLPRGRARVDRRRGNQGAVAVVGSMLLASSTVFRCRC